MQKMLKIEQCINYSKEVVKVIVFLFLLIHVKTQIRLFAIILFLVFFFHKYIILIVFSSITISLIYALKSTNSIFESTL
jgi:hypothetical protein